MSASASLLESPGPSFVMASLLTAYPEAEFGQNLRILLEDQLNSSFGGPTVRQAFGNLQTRLLEVIGSDERLDDLRSEYIDLFDRGRQVNSLYETEYGRERALVKGNELVDIAGFYRAFGFELDGDGERSEMLDHVSVELEFYSLLVLKSALLEDLGDHRLVTRRQSESYVSHAAGAP